MEKEKIIKLIKSLGFKETNHTIVYSLSGTLLPINDNNECPEFIINIGKDYSNKGDYTEYNPTDNYLSLYIL